MAAPGLHSLTTGSESLPRLRPPPRPRDTMTAVEYQRPSWPEISALLKGT